MRQLFLGAILCAVGCAPMIMTMNVAPVDRQAAQVALQAGDATIRGSALIRQQGGGVVDCAGNAVYLIPATESVTRELVRVFGAESGYVARGGSATMGGGTLVSPPEPYRTSICNTQGSFTFTDVTAGKWHVMTSVTWAVGGQYQGGTLLVTTEVQPGGTVEVVLAAR